MVRLAKTKSGTNPGEVGEEQSSDAGCHSPQGTSCHSSQDRRGAKGDLGGLQLRAGGKISE